MDAASTNLQSAVLFKIHSAVLSLIFAIAATVPPPLGVGPCAIPVTLSAYPSSPQPIGGALPITIHMSVAANTPPNATAYQWSAKVPMDGDVYYPDTGTGNAPNWIWTPKEAGDYLITGKVIILVPSAAHPPPKQVPCGIGTITYHISPQTNSQVTISATPPSMSVPGSIAVHANVPAGGGFPGAVKYKFTFAYGPYFGQPGPGQTATATLTTTTPHADWVLHPQPVPNLYMMQVAAQTYVLNHLVSEGQAKLDPANGYAVLFPPGPCPTPNRTSTPATPFGWLNPITTQNTTQPISTPIGSANCAIAGYTINDIVNNPQVRVRAINVSCNNCHSNFNWQQKSAFCMYAAGFGHAQTDPVLQSLYIDWHNRGCPD